ncbi:hypothetical protein R50073_24090 [Maricurvus nonylphenolicus]|uniref:DUF7931 domain-containing protein n=1 Tax=Maricurvus nonylphenolicus TaxID=1008307 RepID=UPI0036F42E4A
MSNKSGRISLDSPEAFRQRLGQLLADCRYSLNILSNDLDSTLWGLENLSAELSRLNREARNRCQIHILVKDPHLLINTPHRLAQIHKRLPTIVQIRQLQLEPQNEQINYIIADRQVLLFQHQHGVYQGFFDPEARAEAQGLLDEYTELWQRHSSDIAELRQLSL